MVRFEEARDKWTHHHIRQHRKFDTFFTLERYTSFREHPLIAWGSAYEMMFCEHTTFNIKESPALLAKLLNSTAFAVVW
jgi:hypothetical protein